MHNQTSPNLIEVNTEYGTMVSRIALRMILNKEIAREAGQEV